LAKIERRKEKDIFVVCTALSPVRNGYSLHAYTH